MLLWLGLGEVLTDAVEDVEPQGEAVLEGQAESLKLSVDASDKDVETLAEKDAVPDARALALGHTLALRLCVFVGDAERDRVPEGDVLGQRELLPLLEGLALVLEVGLGLALPLEPPLPEAPPLRVRDTLGHCDAVEVGHGDGGDEGEAPPLSEGLCVELRLGDTDALAQPLPPAVPLQPLLVPLMEGEEELLPGAEGAGVEELEAAPDALALPLLLSESACRRLRWPARAPLPAPSAACGSAPSACDKIDRGAGGWLLNPREEGAGITCRRALPPAAPERARPACNAGVSARGRRCRSDSQPTPARQRREKKRNKGLCIFIVARVG